MLKPEARLQVSLESITFSGGETIALEPDSVTLIVGPNSSGKTTSLREIHRLLRKDDDNWNSLEYPEPPPPVVVKELHIKKSGTVDDLKAWLQEKIFLGTHKHDPKVAYRWLGHQCEQRYVASSWKSQQLGSLAGILCFIVDVEDRLKVSVAPEAVESFQNPPEHPIHVLLRDDQMELTVSEYFREAFHTDLILKRAGGKKNSVHVGSRFGLGESPDRASPAYINKLVKYQELDQLGHGMRSFAGCLLHVFTSPAFVLLIDEPEVFLHPPHARLLGTLLAREKLPSKQLIIATHSADFIRGVIDAGGKNTKVVRITRDGDVNHARELRADQIQLLWADPILRFSNILDGLFHEIAIICEGDADCRFYSAVADVIERKPKQKPDALFTWTNGKHRLPTVVASLRGVGVPTRVVADFDIFQEEQPLAQLVNNLGGDWSSIRPDWEFINKSIQVKFPAPSPREIGKAINSILDQEKSDTLSERGVKQIREKLKALSPWDMAKLSGVGVVPNGQPTERLNSLLGKLRSIGIFVVECGELERFCPSVGGKGPKWVSEVLTSKNIATDPELESARKFVTELIFGELVRSEIPKRKTSSESVPAMTDNSEADKKRSPLSFLKRLID
jgi:energy-coupling factor transporter ATP-binding protein EcfA2